MLLFFGLLYAILSATPYAGAADEGALVLDIGGSIVEQPADADPLELISGASVIREYRLRDVVHALETAAKDNRVKAVALDLDVFVGGGQARSEEHTSELQSLMRNSYAVFCLKKKKKKIKKHRTRELTSHYTNSH